MVVFRGDPCGIICIVVTYSAVFYADYVVVRHLVLPSMSDSYQSWLYNLKWVISSWFDTTDRLWGAFNVLFFNTIVFLLTVAHLRAVMSDPGIVPLPKHCIDFSEIRNGTQRLTDGWSICMKCETYRPPRAHHCRICQRCIRKMDHHCPWINNCVGEWNQKYFMQFLFYVGLAAVHAVIMVIVSWVLDPAVGKDDGKHIKLVHSIILVIESLLFGLFVIAIGCDQLTSIFNDETGVEYVKKEGLHRSQSNMSLLREVFGRGHPALWLCPLFDNTVDKDRTIEYTALHEI